MRKVVKKYTTFNKIRLALFVHSYAHYRITQYVKRKYKINEKLTSKELRKRCSSKYAIPEISRLAKTMNLNYLLLLKSIFLEKYPKLNINKVNKEKINVFLSIESEIITLATAKQNKSEFKDPDYETELAVLSLAIERVVGNDLKDIEDDFVFEQQLIETKRKYVYLYYKIAYKYKLPTTRIVPFILRLIS